MSITTKNTEVAVNDILPVLNKEAIAEVKVIHQLTKKRKISIGVSMKKKPKTNSRFTEKYRRRQKQSRTITTSEVVHDLSKVHLNIMIEKAINNQDQDHQKGKDTTEVGHNL